MPPPVPSLSVEPLPCPACGAQTGVPLLYGLPTDKARALAEQGEVMLAGCVIRPEDFGCPECGARWGTDGVVLKFEAPPPPVPSR